jgi:hypothetical protein
MNFSNEDAPALYSMMVGDGYSTFWYLGRYKGRLILGSGDRVLCISEHKTRPMAEVDGRAVAYRSMPGFPLPGSTIDGSEVVEWHTGFCVTEDGEIHKNMGLRYDLWTDLPAVPTDSSTNLAPGDLYFDENDVLMEVIALTNRSMNVKRHPSDGWTIVPQSVREKVSVDDAIGVPGQSAMIRKSIIIEADYNERRWFYIQGRLSEFSYGSWVRNRPSSGTRNTYRLTEPTKDMTPEILASVYPFLGFGGEKVNGMVFRDGVISFRGNDDEVLWSGTFHDLTRADGFSVR